MSDYHNEFSKYCYTQFYDCDCDSISKFMKWLVCCSDFEFEQFVNFHFEFSDTLLDRLIKYCEVTIQGNFNKQLEA